MTPRCCSSCAAGGAAALAGDARANRCSVLTYSSLSRSASCSAASRHLAQPRPTVRPARRRAPAAAGPSSARTAAASAAGSGVHLRGRSPGRCRPVCSSSVSSRCSGRISGCPSRSASCCAREDRFLGLLGVLVEVHDVLPCAQAADQLRSSLRQRLVVLPLLRSSASGAAGRRPWRRGRRASSGLPTTRHAVSLQPEHLPALRRLRNLEPHRRR